MLMGCMCTQVTLAFISFVEHEYTLSVTKLDGFKGRYVSVESAFH